MPHINLDDFMMYYEIHGEGTPLVLLHGNGEDHHYFERQVVKFQMQYKVIVIDTRGHGKSTRGEKPYHFETFAHDVYQLLEALSIPSAHILGFSDGGNIAMYLAIHYPQKVKKLILNGANMEPKGLKSYVLKMIQAQYKVSSMLAVIYKKMIKTKERFALMALYPNLTKEDLQKIKSPTLILVGEHDMIKRQHSQYMAQCIPSAKWVQIKGANHFVSKQRASAFHQEVLTFLSEE